MYIYRTLGVVSSSLDPPYWEIEFDCACVCVACVRAKLRGRDASAVAGGCQLQVVGVVWSARHLASPTGPAQNHSLAFWLELC